MHVTRPIAILGCVAVAKEELVEAIVQLLQLVHARSIKRMIHDRNVLGGICGAI